ncbi:MAG: hypothetical protein OEV30_06530 [Ignavibacteria bacterium]|nr:hypothetical protein [Ignavibacteria bacterium]
MIKVTSLDATTLLVTVIGTKTTRHTVTVAPEYAEKLTGGNHTTAELVRKSFEFLLEREPNTSILTEFDLPVISRYFPEYEQVIAEML